MKKLLYLIFILFFVNASNANTVEINQSSDLTINQKINLPIQQEPCCVTATRIASYSSIDCWEQPFTVQQTATKSHCDTNGDCTAAYREAGRQAYHYAMIQAILAAALIEDLCDNPYQP